MNEFFKWHIFVIVVAVFAAVSASADMIHLRNGDRISGEVIRMEQGKPVVKTDYVKDGKIYKNTL